MIRQQLSSATNSIPPILCDRHSSSAGYWRVGALLMLVFGLISGVPGEAQLRFERRTDSVNIENYGTIEECVAATSRLHREAVTVARYEVEVDIDTMPIIAVDPPLPRRIIPVLDFARQCGKQFSPSTFPMNDGWDLFMGILWQAERFAAVDTLLERRMATIVNNDSAQYAAVLDTIIGVYQKLHPRQLELADSLLNVRMSLPAHGRMNIQSFLLNFDQFKYARMSNDTVLAHNAADRIRRLNLTVTDEDRQDRVFIEYARPPIYAALSYLSNSRGGLDSLKKGIASYIALQRNNWSQVSGGFASDYGFAVGEYALPLPTDFVWANPSYPQAQAVRNDLTTEIPQQGRVGLIIFYGHECYREQGIGLPIGKNYSPCRSGFAALKRLAKRFPELDITVVAETHGYFSYLNPVTPPEEAEWLRRWTHEYLQLPGRLAVATIPHWALQAPDNRRIDETLPYVTSYAFGKKNDGRDWVVPETAFLVSRDGIIIHKDRLSTPWTPFSEKEFGGLIEILLDRNPMMASTVASDGANKLVHAELAKGSKRGDSGVSTITVTDERIGQLLRIVASIEKDVDSDISKLPVLRNAIISLVQSRGKVALPGDAEGAGMPKLIDEMLEREKISFKDFVTLLFRATTAYTIVHGEKTLSVEHAKEAASINAKMIENRTGTNLSPDELATVRKYYDEIYKMQERLIRVLNPELGGS